MFYLTIKLAPSATDAVEGIGYLLLYLKEKYHIEESQSSSTP
jgi:hypothetical protein